VSLKFTNNLPRITARVHSRAGSVVRKTVAELEARIKISFSEPKHGNVDSRGHQASAPGEAPAIDYGHLASSVQAFMETATKGGVGVGAEYGPDLEYGTSDMEPRPFMVPQAEGIKREFQESLRNLT
jgi:hypothetical protein